MNVVILFQEEKSFIINIFDPLPNCAYEITYSDCDSLS